MHVERVAKVTRDTMFYQQKLEGGETQEEITIEELLEPLESAYSRVERLADGKNFNYNGFEDQEIDADYGVGMITWTLGKNWEKHAADADKDVDFNLDVEETDCFYEIDIWDTGDGLYDEVSGEDPKSAETRYRQADTLFKSERDSTDSGHGLQMAKDIAELYNVDLFYSEEMLEDRGFGVKMKIRKY